MTKIRQKPLTAKNLELPKPPKTMTASEIITLRKKKLKVSQAVFASLLNISPGAVRSWEQSINEPCGATLRLLQIVRKKPEILLQYLR
jgi:putative transcriptional regulator